MLGDPLQLQAVVDKHLRPLVRKLAPNIPPHVVEDWQDEIVVRVYEKAARMPYIGTQRQQDRWLQLTVRSQFFDLLRSYLAEVTLIRVNRDQLFPQTAFEDQDEDQPTQTFVSQLTPDLLLQLYELGYEQLDDLFGQSLPATSKRKRITLFEAFLTGFPGSYPTTFSEFLTMLYSQGWYGSPKTVWTKFSDFEFTPGGIIMRMTEKTLNKISQAFQTDLTKLTPHQQVVLLIYILEGTTPFQLLGINPTFEPFYRQLTDRLTPVDPFALPPEIVQQIRKMYLLLLDGHSLDFALPRKKRQRVRREDIFVKQGSISGPFVRVSEDGQVQSNCPRDVSNTKTNDLGGLIMKLQDLIEQTKVAQETQHAQAEAQLQSPAEDVQPTAQPEAQEPKKAKTSKAKKAKTSKAKKGKTSKAKKDTKSKKDEQSQEAQAPTEDVQPTAQPESQEPVQPEAQPAETPKKRGRKPKAEGKGTSRTKTPPEVKEKVTAFVEQQFNSGIQTFAEIWPLIQQNPEFEGVTEQFVKQQIGRLRKQAGQIQKVRITAPWVRIVCELVKQGVTSLEEVQKHLRQQGFNVKDRFVYQRIEEAKMVFGQNQG